MIDFKYEVRIFPVSENGENGLGHEGADGGNALIICGLEPPLDLLSNFGNDKGILKIFGTTKTTLNLFLKAIFPHVYFSEKNFTLKISIAV